jgi:hypothetical protein
MAGIYVLQLCTSGGLVDVEINGLIFSGIAYSFSGENGTVLCGEVIELSESLTSNYTGISYYIGGCSECMDDNTIYVNYEYTLCTPNCSGDTIELTLPHPVWTTNYGMNVVQQNAAQIGGIDGLNN